ncbi:protein WHAT'S THIS FACTOR 9, mitochondrial [Silene latifolia]|uniref:protein WHAT'S THIS FACTOR 9, mitochondrial n=1 Tax=Silene latifolia TaxID=37657 RepID=UPI003D786A3E
MLYKSKVARVLLKDHQTPSKCQFLRTFVDNLEIKFVRDRGLDHAVEREKDLKPVINLKNLLKLEPSKSLPVSTIVDNNETLKIPYRPIEFIRSYPSVFEEFFPGDIRVHPHVRLTPESLDLDAQEQLIFNSETVRKNAADRLLKLLMLCRANEIPLRLIDRFKWDLGLPDNYVNSLVPEFPDYFQMKQGKHGDSVLELVCWSDDMSVSVMEKMAKKVNKDYEKGMPIEFPMRFSKGFEMDKKLKKWIDEWQKLPYLSPYENASHLPPNGDMTDRWAVGVLHELLHILGPKKTERENILCLGDYLGVKPRLKRAMAHHPGIFYLSSKIGTYTVVLKEGYRRGLLVDGNPLVDMRGKYIHLMHTVKEKSKQEGGVDGSKQKVVKGGGAVKENVKPDGKELDEKMQVVDFVEDESDDDDDDEEDEEDEEEEEVKEKVKGRGASERRGSIEVSEDDEGRGRGGSRGGFNKGNEEGRGRSGSIDGRRGFNLDRQERGGNRSGRGGFSRGNGERQERGGNRSERGGFSRGNGERQERSGDRSERGGFNRGNGERQERGGNRCERGGFSRGNGERQERGGNRSERGGFNRGNGDRQERGGGEKRGERGGFKRGNEEGKESGGNRSGRRESERFEEARPRSGHGRGGGRGGIRDFGKV